MEYLLNGFQEAVRLLYTGESGVYTIVGVSVFVAVSAILLASVMGLPAGYFLATHRFRGQRLVTTVLNTLLAMPTVVIGLFVYAMISRRGPLGFMELLYTPKAMIIGETILALPIVAAFTLSAFRAVIRGSPKRPLRWAPRRPRRPARSYRRPGSGSWRRWSPPSAG